MNHQNEAQQETDQLTYAEVVELLPGFVLGALEPNEMLAVESYLSQHQALVARLQQLEITSAQLVHIAPLLTPPPQIKADLMTRVTAEVAKSVAQSVQQSVIQPVPSSQPKPTRTTTPQYHPNNALRSFFQTIFSSIYLKVTFGIGAVAICLLAIATASSLSVINQLSTQRTAMQEQVQRLQVSNHSLEQKLLEQQNQVASFTDAQRVITLSGTEYAPQASGLAYLSPNETVLVFRNLAPLPESETYQLWLIPESGNPVSAGLVDISGPESITRIVSTETPFVKIGLSIEPAGGSDVPTGAIILLG